MNQVFNGKLKQHKGWTKFIVYWLIVGAVAWFRSSRI
jgi:hypothetical protein